MKVYYNLRAKGIININCHCGSSRNMISEFLEPGDKRWRSVLDSADHDFYHLPEYVSFAAKHEGGKPAAFYYSNGGKQFLAPLLIKALPVHLKAPSDWCDSSSPYGYPSPMMSGTIDSDFLTRALYAFREEGTRQGIISAFFRLHPLLPLPNDCLSDAGVLINHGKTVYVDLSDPEEEIQAQLRRDHRKDIRKLVESDYHVSKDDWSKIDDFIRIYLDDMKRVGAPQFYLFSKEYFRDIRHALKGRVHLFSITTGKGEVAAAGLFIENDAYISNHLTATSANHFRMAPSKLLYHQVRIWAKEAGLHYYHLGGGVGGKTDSLFKFKSGFSNKTAGFYTFRMVLDEDKYRLLSEKAGNNDTSADSESTEYFPVYRK